MERIGLIVVHGIGEQRRFEFLDGYVRELIRALRDDGNYVSVNIANAPAAAFQAAQDTWSGGHGPTVVLHVRAPEGALKQIGVHEVWWADINEPSSIRKQIRFWLWGLGVWLYPLRDGSELAGARERMVIPQVKQEVWWARTRLYLVASSFVLSALSIGTLLNLASRLLSTERFKVMQLVANYVSGVKLYNQRHRYDASLFMNRPQEFLDSIGDPPRVSIRRRMIRAVADAACQPYDRWYIMAHSQGTIPAFNALMETAYSWPGYLDPDRTDRLCKRGMLVRPCATATPSIPPNGRPSPTLPGRPTWCPPDLIASRRRIFCNFRGMLTFGSPLEKFATIWPILVPISREPALAPDTCWINVYDPVDPVSGRLEAFESKDYKWEGTPEVCCPPLHNIGYRAGPLLLLNHLQYFLPRRTRKGTTDLATAFGRWLLSGNPAEITARMGSGTRRWFPPGAAVARARSCLAIATWAVATIVTALVAWLVLPPVVDALARALAALLCRVDVCTTSGLAPVPHRAIWTAAGLAVLVLPAVVGAFNRMLLYPGEAYKRDKPQLPPSGDQWALQPED